MDFVTNDHSLPLHSAKMMFLAAMTWIMPVVLGAPHLPSLPRDLKEASLLIKFDKNESGARSRCCGHGVPGLRTVLQQDVRFWGLCRLPHLYRP